MIDSLLSAVLIVLIAYVVICGAGGFILKKMFPKDDAIS